VLSWLELRKVLAQRSLWIAGVLLLALLSFVVVSSSPGGTGPMTPGLKATFFHPGQISQSEYRAAHTQCSHLQIDSKSAQTAYASRELEADQLIVTGWTSQQSLRQGLLARATALRHVPPDQRGGYAYQALELQQAMCAKLPSPGSGWFTPGYGIMDNETTTALEAMVIGLLLVMGLTSIWSREYADGTDALIFASARGRSRLFVAKLIAASAYATLVVTVTVITVLAETAVSAPGLIGADYPLNALHLMPQFPQFSPYNFTLVQFFAFQVGFALLSSVSFAAILCLLSALTRVTTAVLASGIALYGVPLVLRRISTIPVSVHHLLGYTWVYGVILWPSFERFAVFNWFDHPIVRPLGLLFAMVFTGLLAVVAQRVSLWRREVV
jgi:hypothetical protein